MRFSFLAISISSFVLTVSCANHEIVVNKRCRYQMSVYPDSSFVGELKGFQFHDNHLYFLDINRRSIIMLDKDLSVLHSISRGGRAQKELLEPFSFTVYKDSIFIIDFGGFKMKVFHKGEFVDERPIPVNTRDQRFVMDGNVFFLPIKDTEASVVRTSLTCTPIVVLQAEQYFSPVKTLTMNSCHVLSYEENLVIVPESMPWVKIISKDGEVIRTIDLSDSAVYNRNISFAHKADREEKGFYILNSDACVDGDNLLILIPTYGNHYTCNRIVSVNLNTSEIRETVMSLSGKVYSSICSNGNVIYAFNSSENQIEVYEF